MFPRSEINLKPVGFGETGDYILLGSEGIDDDAVRSKLLNEHGIEIGVGLGKTRGKIWRIGLMGESSSKENVDIFISALKESIS